MRAPILKDYTVINYTLVRWYDIDPFSGTRLGGPNLPCFQEFQQKTTRKEADCRFDGAVLKPHILIHWEEYAY